MMTNVLAKIEAIIAENKKPPFEQFTMDNYEADMEIIQDHVRQINGFANTSILLLVAIDLCSSLRSSETLGMTLMTGVGMTEC